MDSPLYIGLSRQVALRRQLEVAANNIANMNTAGFRAERLVFEAAMAPGGPRQQGQAAFTIDRATYTDHRSGPLAQTGNPYDVALDGDGWLQVSTADGIRYTRDGRMHRDSDGLLVNAGGDPYLDDGGKPIAIPADGSVLEIGIDGIVTADGQMLGRLGLTAFDAPQALRQAGDVLFDAGADAGRRPSPDTRVVQGKIEESNVQAIAELTRVMDLSRDYQAVSNMVEQGQDLIKSAINRLGRSS